MEEFINVGPAITVTLACIGSAIGVSYASMSSHGAMTQSSSGHGKYLLLTAAPSSQAIYGFVTMILMKNAIIAGSISANSCIIIGFFTGLALMMSAIYQGKVSSTAIIALTKDQNILGKALVTIGMIESFALFAFIFVVMLF